MVNIKKVFRENRLLIKMQCMYCIVLVLGILVAAFFITRDMLDDLIATQLIFEKDMQQNISSDISDIYDDIVWKAI